MLKGVKVLEFEGLAPSLFVGMMLTDYGAENMLLSRSDAPQPSNLMNRGKKSLTFDLKKKEDVDTIKLMIQSADILIDPYRPGVLERIGLSYQVCSQINPKLIYARISSFGQSSPLREAAGHDINFLSYSGALSLCASTGTSKWPAIPVNLLGDFAAGGALATAAILAALHQVQKGGSGQEIDIGMAQGSFYLTQFILQQKRSSLWQSPRGNNTLDGGAHFYNIYQCQDGLFFTVGCIEEKFYDQFLLALRKSGDLSEERQHYFKDNHYNQAEWESLKTELQTIFLRRTRQEWEVVFKSFDACVSPVLELDELQQRRDLGNDLVWLRDGHLEAAPQPKFSGTKFQQKAIPKLGEHNAEKPRPKL